MIAPPLALLLLQAATAAASPASPADGRFSILTDPCANASNDGGDVVVCGRPQSIAPRLPLPRFRGPPDHPVPSNPDMKASVALDGPGVGDACGAYGEDCPIGGGGYVIPKAVDGAVGAVRRAFARKPDKTGRVAIDLSDPPPVDASQKVHP